MCIMQPTIMGFWTITSLTGLLRKLIRLESGGSGSGGDGGSGNNSGGNGGGSSDWQGKKLKMVPCKCSNGDNGKTLKCDPAGDLEDCTVTQQGSNACYKVGLSGMKLCT